MGDKSFEGKAVGLSGSDTSFLSRAMGCAYGIEATWKAAAGRAPPTWLVVSDTPGARALAVSNATGAGRRVVSPAGSRAVQHTGLIARASTEPLRRALVDAFGEWWLLGECDFVVSASAMWTKNSGFSATAAMRTFRRGRGFLPLHVEENGRIISPACGSRHANNPLPKCPMNPESASCKSLLAASPGDVGAPSFMLPSKVKVTIDRGGGVKEDIWINRDGKLTPQQLQALRDEAGKKKHPAAESMAQKIAKARARANAERAHPRVRRAFMRSVAWTYPP